MQNRIVFQELSLRCKGFPGYSSSQARSLKLPKHFLYRNRVMQKLRRFVQVQSKEFIQENILYAMLMY